MRVRYSYLPQQFNRIETLWNKLKKFVKSGDFTLGKELKIFEQNFAKLIGSKYANIDIIHNVCKETDDIRVKNKPNLLSTFVTTKPADIKPKEKHEATIPIVNSE